MKLKIFGTKFKDLNKKRFILLLVALFVILYLFVYFVQFATSSPTFTDWANTPLELTNWHYWILFLLGVVKIAKENNYE